MGVVWHTPESERAEQHADDGDHQTAASLAARSAQSRFQQHGLTSLGSNGNMAVGDLLFAICCARKAGAEDTAVHLRGTLGFYTRVIHKCAHRRLRDEWPSVTWACLAGLCEEWTGDAYLLTGDGKAGWYYDRAEPWYHLEGCREEHLQRDSPAPCWQWGMEPEFEKAWEAFQQHIDWLEIGPPGEADVHDDDETNSVDRLAYKRRVLSAATA